jgi:hypothetical protein
LNAPIPPAPPAFTNTKYLTLNGSDEYAYIAAGALNVGKTSMVSFWLDPRTLSSAYVFGNTNTNCQLMTLSTGRLRLRLGLDNLATAVILTANTWAHYVFVKNALVVDVYKNGAYIETINYTSDLDIFLQYIGTNSSIANLLNCYIDEFAAWNTAPAAYAGSVPSQVTALYGSGTPATCGNAATVMAANLKAFWRFEGNANDETGTYNLTTQGIDASNYVSY